MFDKLFDKTKSWKTNACATIVFAAGLVECVAHLKSIPVNAASIMGDISETLAYTGGALGLFFSRDNDKTSEDIGVK